MQQLSNIATCCPLARQRGPISAGRSLFFTRFAGWLSATQERLARQNELPGVCPGGSLDALRTDDEEEVKRVRRGDDQHDDDARAHAVGRIDRPAIPEQAGADQHHGDVQRERGPTSRPAGSCGIRRSLVH